MSYFYTSHAIFTTWKRLINESSTIRRKKYYHTRSMNALGNFIRRFFDILISAICLIVFSPLFLICYIAIKIEDGGDAIFKQERIGKNGKAFYIYKFRSMRMDAEKNGPALCQDEEDNRLTKTGRFLRAHHLDELPQLWNVLKGDMAFVGVTSYATLYNGYTNTMEKMLKRLELDLYYMEHRSLWMDFSILAKTFFSIVFGKKF